MHGQFKRGITALFNNMRTLKFEGRPTNAFFRCRQSNVRRVLSAYDYHLALFRRLNCAQRFDYHALGSCQKLGGAAEHLIDGSEKRICLLSLNFSSMLRKFAGKFSNIDFFLKILPLKDDELVMSGMQKNWGVTDIVLEGTCPEEHLNLSKSGFVSG